MNNRQLGMDVLVIEIVCIRSVLNFIRFKQPKEGY